MHIQYDLLILTNYFFICFSKTNWSLCQTAVFFSLLQNIVIEITIFGSFSNNLISSSIQKHHNQQRWSFWWQYFLFSDDRDRLLVLRAFLYLSPRSGKVFNIVWSTWVLLVVLASVQYIEFPGLHYSSLDLIFYGIYCDLKNLQ